jgi:hypothetical protein
VWVCGRQGEVSNVLRTVFEVFPVVIYVKRERGSSDVRVLNGKG